MLASVFVSLVIFCEICFCGFFISLRSRGLLELFVSCREHDSRAYSA